MATSAEILESRILLAAPIAEDDEVETDENTVLMGNVLADNGNGADSDADADSISVFSVNGDPASVGVQITLASGALLTVESNGDFTYDPTAAFDDIPLGQIETDSFTYQIWDGSVASMTATVMITISGANGAPAVLGELVQIRKDQLAIGSVLSNDSDPDGQSITVTHINGDAMLVGTEFTLASGAVLIINGNGSYQYRPAGDLLKLRSGESIVDTVTYTVSDGTLAATTSLSVRVLGGGSEDLIGFSGGAWRVSAWNGTSVSTATWATWADTAWDALGQGDFNGDGRTDVLGLLDGMWYVGLSSGTNFVASGWTTWANVAWENVTVGDLNGDGRDDILARIGGSWWAALSNGTSFDAPLKWGTWAALPWQTYLVDLDNDGDEDLLAFYAGEWWVGRSNGATAFDPAQLWARWANAPWQVGIMDVNEDGQTDVFGLLSGEWYVGTSTGSVFSTALRVRWAFANWQDARAGDVNGDGLDDLVARFGGQWWLSVSGAGAAGAGGPTSLFAAWSNVAWQDVRIGDLNGDGRDDIAARIGGEWWIARSSGTTATTQKWAVWADAPWQAVAAVDVDNQIGLLMGAPAAGSGGGAALAALEEESLSRFWSLAADDDELSRGLLSASAA